MANANRLRKEAERKNIMAEALEEQERAERLRSQADQAEKRASELKSRAGGDDGDEIAILTLFVVGILVCFWYFWM